MHPDWKEKPTLKELVDGIVGNAGPKPPEGFREDVEDVIARAIEIAYDVNSKVIRPRHPVVVRWRDDAIDACASIAEAYGNARAARDMRAMMVHPHNSKPDSTVGTAPEHVLYKTGDKDAPEQIRDRNGDVALRLCRRCGRGEVELEEPCAAKKAK